MKHVPVFKDKLVPNLGVNPDGIYFDATLGAGGHASQILQALGKEGEGKLIVCDVDALALENFATQHAEAIEAGKLIVKQDNFNNLQSIVLEVLSGKKLDGIIADLGWSTDQLEHIPGLSFQVEEAELDMRLDANLRYSAADILNSYSDSQLAALFVEFADSDRKEVKLLVDEVVSRRKLGDFRNVIDLNQALNEIKPLLRRKHNLEKRIYQALRIVVNNEYQSLNLLISNGIECLKPGGRMLIITFHSGEENIVHQKLKSLEEANVVSWIWEQQPYLQPEVSELRQNFQAHSAKLWGITKS